MLIDLRWLTYLLQAATRRPHRVPRTAKSARSLLGELIPLALVVALSPLSIIPAVLLVLHTDRPRPTGLAFMAGWLVGLAALTVVFVRCLTWSTGSVESPTLGAVGANRDRRRC